MSGSKKSKPQPSRRDVLKMTAAAGAAGLTPLKVLAGSPGPQVKKFRAPEDKGLSEFDFKMLRRKGRPTVYQGDDLTYIGMPIGGLCTGQLYLSGDGRLWHWDIFNQPGNTRNDSVYVEPLETESTVGQGFNLSWRGESGSGSLNLDGSGFSDVTFRGQYPISEIFFKKSGCPLEVELEAYSPFSPLETELSSQPVTCFIYKVTNMSDEPVTADVRGWLENRVLSFSGNQADGYRVNEAFSNYGWSGVSLEAKINPPQKSSQSRSEIVVEDWSSGTYKGWKVEGTAFGTGPQLSADLPDYMGAVAATTKYVVNTHETRNGEDVTVADQHTGALTSSPFKIERDWISFRIGGGNHKDRTCMRLLIDGKEILSQTGKSSNRMEWASFRVSSHVGESAQLQIVDAEKGGWGQISIGEITQTDEPRSEPFVANRQGDWGTMALLAEGGQVFVDHNNLSKTAHSAPLDWELPVGAVQNSKTIAPGATEEFKFIMAWHFPNPWRDSLGFVTDIQKLDRWYATQSDSAQDAGLQAAAAFADQREKTELWRDTWHDSTLPQWFLERTFINTSILASSTCYRFSNDRFYGWEGNYCCAGTCTHVWGYAQSSGRVFPELERSLRTQVDFGVSWNEDGAIDYRGEAAQHVAHDGQCTVILRAYREHLMSKDDKYLNSIYPRLKQSIQHMIDQDGGQDGIFEGRQYNTLDATWWGPMAWITSLYLAVLAAGKEMAAEMDDDGFARTCEGILKKGQDKFKDELYNGEFFVHKQDKNHRESNGTGPGCHIDQVFGQSWAHQVGLGDVLPKEETKSALNSLWRYSFLPDVGPYREKINDTINGGRWYAMPGEGGLVMCSWPNGGTEAAVGEGGEAWAAMYFNECMHGFEYQVAAHMMHEGMVDESLAICKSVHDRYQGHKRNPFNEIECGTHYARSMASHGVYISACGFYHHGPMGIIGFAPRMNAEDFKAAWIGAEGWGSYSQNTTDGFEAELVVKHGSLNLKEIRTGASRNAALVVAVNGEFLASRGTGSGSATLAESVTLEAGDMLTVTI